MPHAHQLRLREALPKAGGATELVTVPGGKHGGFSREQRTMVYTAIKAFLAKHNLPTTP